MVRGKQHLDCERKSTQRGQWGSKKTVGLVYGPLGALSAPRSQL